MKKVIFFFALIFLVSGVSVFAADNPALLKKADINIESAEDHTYKVIEKITLQNSESIQDQTITHTFSNLRNTSFSKLVITSNGQELEFKLEEGEALNKLFLSIPENVAGEFSYEIQYKLTLEEDSYTTPLFVPLVPAAGKENVVHLEFIAPEGQQIQKNSFPVIIDDVENVVEKHIMNIPSHVRYVYGDEINIFNVFNIFSWGVLLGLIAIIVVWFRAELNKSKGVAG